MQLYPFNALDLKKRSDLLWKRGIFITICKRQRPYVQYFMINDFYVEMQFDPASIKMLGLIAFDGGERYERMLEAIRLDELLDQDAA
jgi:hypothetical protein